MTLTAILIPENDGGFVALNPETGTTTQGDNLMDAVTNLREATELYLEEFSFEPTEKAFVTTFEVTYA